MTILSNSPQESTVIEAEARKSLSFGIWLKQLNGAPVDITGASTTFTVGKVDRYGVSTALLSTTALIQAPTLGYLVVQVQAADTDLKPGIYQFTTTLRMNGYSVVLMKGDFKVLQNTEFSSTGETFFAVNPAQNLEVVLRDQLNVHITLSSILAPNIATPSDASDLAVAGYIADSSSFTYSKLNEIFVTHVELADALAAERVLTNSQIDSVLLSSSSYTDSALLEARGYTDSSVATRIPSSTLTSKGDILARTSSTPTRLPVGSNGRVLIADSSQSTGLRWGVATENLQKTIGQGAGSPRWAKIATINGVNDLTGASIDMIYSSGGDYGSREKNIGRLSFMERGGVASLNWETDFPPSTSNPHNFGIKKISAYVFELWMILGTNNFESTFTLIGGSGSRTFNVATPVTTNPGTLVLQNQFSAVQRGTTTQRNQAFPTPSTTTEQLALANLNVEWFNTTKNIRERYYAATTNRTAGWWPAPGMHSVVPTSVSGGSIDANGRVYASGSSSNLRILGCFSEDFYEYKLVSRLLANAITAHYARFITSAGSDYTSPNYWEGVTSVTSGGTSGSVGAYDRWQTAAVGAIGQVLDADIHTPAHVNQTHNTFSVSNFGGAAGHQTGMTSIENDTVFTGLSFLNSVGSTFTSVSYVQIFGIA